MKQMKEMSNRHKIIIVWGVIFLILLVSFAFPGIMISWGITGSIVKGIAFSLGLAIILASALSYVFVYINSDAQYDKRKPAVGSGEYFIKKATAGFLRDGVYIGGYLFLTNRFVYFVSLAIVLDPIKTVIPIDDIIKVENDKTNGEIVICVEENSFMFRVGEGTEWCNLINNEKRQSDIEVLK